MRSEIYINYLDYVKIKVSGDSSVIKAIENYFPGLVSHMPHQVDYEVNFAGVSQFEPKIPADCNRVVPFKAAEYRTFYLDGIYYAYSSDNEEFSSNHLIEKHGKKYNIYAFGSNYKMLATRVCREIIFRKLLHLGFIPIHASASCNEERITVYVGQSGVGKTACIMHNIRFKKDRPMSGDVLMIGGTKSCLDVVGLPFKISFYPDSDHIAENALINKKEKLTPALFEKKFNTTWQWSGKVETMYLLNCGAEECFSIQGVNKEAFLQFMKNVRAEEIFGFGDYLGLGDKKIDMESIYFPECLEVRGELNRFLKKVEQK